MTTYAIPPNYANHILVASPSMLVRQRVLDSLRSPVRSFEQATGGAEALLHLESGGWEVLFLDRHLPDLDAEELSATVRRRFPEIEVVLLDSELDSEPDSKNGIELTENYGVADALGCPAEPVLASHASATATAETEPAATVRDPQSGVEDPLPRDDRQLPHHATGVSSGAAAGAAKYHCLDHRTDGLRQRDHGPRHPSIKPARGGDVCGRQLRGDSRNFARSRTLRIFARGLHRRDQVLFRKNSNGARRNAFSR